MKLPSRYKPTGAHFGGGQGVVSIWNDTSLGRDVAVKVLATRGIGGSIRDEAALLGAIKSKHVVELFEIGIDTSTGKEFLIMEYVDGPDLSGYAAVDARELLLTLYQITCGVSDIHHANCLHRDLKPDNIKRDSAQIIKIIDFGIGGPNPVNTTHGRGTEGYRAPEYYSHPIRLTAAADIYVLGVIAYEFCFGALHPDLCLTPPASPPSFATASIGSARARLPAEISAMLDLCLSASPIYRPSAERLRTTLGKHLLRNKHIADFVYGGTMYSMSQSSPQYSISAPKGMFEVTYNGLDFILTNVTGEVFINGSSSGSGMVLPGSCVITIGSGSGPDRVFIPFNVSHPEVIL